MITFFSWKGRVYLREELNRGYTVVETPKSNIICEQYIKNTFRIYLREHNQIDLSLDIHIQYMA